MVNSEKAAGGSQRVGGLVLCGGRSTRMGSSKAHLAFGRETMLGRVVRLLNQIVEPIVVVAAPEQPLPPLPSAVLVARDDREGQGPVQGLYAGLAEIAPHVDAVYATSCDVPLLQPAFVASLISRLNDYEIVVPVEDRFHHPLAAVYRTSVLPHLRALLDAGRLRPVFLFDQVRTLRVPVEELRSVDPDLRTLANLNTPEQYTAALQAAGLAGAGESGKPGA